MSGILGGIVNALGAASQGRDQANQARLQSALQQAQITRQQQQDQIAAAVREREANSSLLKDRLTQAQIGDTEAQAKQRQYEVEHPKPVAPVLGTPEWQNAIDFQERTKSKYDYHAPPQPHGWVPHTKDEYFEVHPPKTGVGGGAAQGAQVPVADMEARYSEIADAAGALGRGEWKITPGMQTREGANYATTIDNAGGHPSAKHLAMSTIMNGVGTGGEDYTKYQSLMNSTRALGDDVAKVFKGRQNEQSVLREVALSQLTPDDYGNPKVVEQKLSRLQHIINLAKLNNPSQDSIGEPSGTINLGKPTQNASQAQQLWDKAVAKYGKSKVLQEYGERPAQ